MLKASLLTGGLVVHNLSDLTQRSASGRLWFHKRRSKHMV